MLHPGSRVAIVDSRVGRRRVARSRYRSGMSVSGRSSPVDGFRLAFDDVGSGPAVVLLHGWPGDRCDFRALVPLLREHARLVVPDLRGFGGSDKHDGPPTEVYSVAAQTRSVLGLMDELGLTSATLVGYDVGSRVAQTVAEQVPDRVDALVLAPPLPGAGRRLLEPEVQGEFCYQHFHQLKVAEELIDGQPQAVRSYLGHIWSRWAGPANQGVADLDHLVEVYGERGAFVASIGWYRAGAGSVARARTEAPPTQRSYVRLHAIWPRHDPLFSLEWADRLDEWYADVTFTEAPESGHFVPLEAPELLARVVLEEIQRSNTPG